MVVRAVTTVFRDQLVSVSFTGLLQEADNLRAVVGESPEELVERCEGWWLGRVVGYWTEGDKYSVAPSYREVKDKEEEAASDGGGPVSEEGEANTSSSGEGSCASAGEAQARGPETSRREVNKAKREKTVGVARGRGGSTGKTAVVESKPPAPAARGSASDSKPQAKHTGKRSRRESQGDRGSKAKRKKTGKKVPPTCRIKSVLVAWLAGRDEKGRVVCGKSVAFGRLQVRHSLAHASPLSFRCVSFVP